MKVRVYLATTGGPVRVERLTRERAQQSAVCLGRTTRVLPISGDYDAFVRQPSGVVERELGPFEPGAFRLDVTAAIDEGDSWQLGVFAAHMLAVSGRLATSEETFESAAWLTGRVDNDLLVGDVAHLPEKLHASRDEFAELLSRGVPITLFLPPGGRQVAEATDLPSDLRLVEVESAADLRLTFGLVSGESGSAGAIQIARDHRPLWSKPPGGNWPKARWIFAALFAAVIGAVVVAAVIALPALHGWKDLTARGDFPRLDEALSTARKSSALPQRLAAMAYELWLAAGRPDDVELVLYLRSPPKGRTCAAVHFRGIEASKSPVTKTAPNVFSSVSHDDLCGLEFAILTGKQPLYVDASLEVSSGQYFEALPKPYYLMGAEPFSGRQGWVINLPRRLNESFAYSIVVVAANYPVTEAAGWWRAHEDQNQAAARMSDLGVFVRSWSHEVSP